MEYERNIMIIEDSVTGDGYFVSDSLRELIKDNISLLLDGEVLRDVMFRGEFKTLKLDNNMRFILIPQEG